MKIFKSIRSAWNALVGLMSSQGSHFTTLEEEKQANPSIVRPCTSAVSHEIKDVAGKLRTQGLPILLDSSVTPGEKHVIIGDYFVNLSVLLEQSKAICLAFGETREEIRVSACQVAGCTGIHYADGKDLQKWATIRAALGQLKERIELAHVNFRSDRVLQDRISHIPKLLDDVENSLGGL